MVSEVYWAMFGLSATGLGFFKWLPQLRATHKKQKVVMPLSTWGIGWINSVIVMTYSIHRIEPIFFIGALFMFCINSYNIYMERKNPTR